MDPPCSNDEACIVQEAKMDNLESKMGTKSDLDDELNSNLKGDFKSDHLDDLKDASGDSSIDSNIEIVNQDELNLIDENKENMENRIKIKIDGDDTCQHSFTNLSHLDRSLDRSKTSIDDLSFSQKTLIKSCSLRSLITELVNDEIMIDKGELSKDLDESEKEKFFQIIKAIKQDDNDKKIEQLKELCKYIHHLKRHHHSNKQLGELIH